MSSHFIVAPGHGDLLRRVGITDLEAALGHRGGRVLVQGKSSFIRILNDPDDVARQVYLKVYLYPKLGARWRYAFKKSRAEREFESAFLLIERGLPAAAPLAHGSRRGSFGQLEASFVATLGVPRTVNLDAILAADADPSAPLADPRMRRRGLEILGGLVGRMHQSGYVDHDLHWRNILVNLDSGVPAFTFIDSPKGEVPRARSALVAGVVHDLASIDKHAPTRFTPRERARFAVAWQREATRFSLRRLRPIVMAEIDSLQKKRARKLAADAREGGR